MLCPRCRSEMTFDDYNAIWKCDRCVLCFPESFMEAYLFIHPERKDELTGAAPVVPGPGAPTYVPSACADTSDSLPPTSPDVVSPPRQVTPPVAEVTEKVRSRIVQEPGRVRYRKYRVLLVIIPLGEKTIITTRILSRFERVHENGIEVQAWASSHDQAVREALNLTKKFKEAK